MDTKLIVALIGIFGAIIGVYVWVARHIAARKKHPCSDDLVFRDVCESERRRIDDCLEGAERRTEQRFKEVKEDMKTGFTEVKDLIRNQLTK